MDKTFFQAKKFTISVDDSSTQNFESKQFFEITLQKLKSNLEEVSCLKFTDVTIKVKHDHIEGKSHILETINATVSHEMRNPINSIISQNIKIEYLVNYLLNTLEENLTLEELKTKVRGVLEELRKSNKIM